MDAFAFLLGFVWWIGTICLTAWLASEKNREVIPWGLAALVFGPIALLALVGAPVKKKGI